MACRTIILVAVAAYLSGAACNASVPGDAAFNAGQFTVAKKIYKAKYRLGNRGAGLRLAAMYMNGIGGLAEPAKAVSIYQELAQAGLSVAEHNLGVCFEYGKGVDVDYGQSEKWYRRAADQFYVPALYNLGSLYSNERISPRNDVEGLTLMFEALELAKGVPSEKARIIRVDAAGHRAKLIGRLSSEEIEKAREQGLQRATAFRTKLKESDGFTDSDS